MLDKLMDTQAMEKYQKDSAQIITKVLRDFFNDEMICFDRSRFAGGMTNYNYVMSIHGSEYIVRQPGPLTEVVIDRRIEEYNTKIIAKYDINSECVYFDSKTGVKISHFMSDSSNLAQAGPTSPESLEAVADLMKRIHTMSSTFKNAFDWKKELEKYESIVELVNGVFFFDYEQLKEKAFILCDEMIQNIELTPCHNDTVPENFLKTQKNKYYLIDWEYSGLNDPAFDLAAFIVETRLSKDEIDELLFNYYGESYPEGTISKIKAFILAQDLLWTAWAIVRHYYGENYADYCEMRYERFRKNTLSLEKDREYPLYKMVDSYGE